MRQGTYTNQKVADNLASNTGGTLTVRLTFFRGIFHGFCGPRIYLSLVGSAQTFAVQCLFFSWAKYGILTVAP